MPRLVARRRKVGNGISRATLPPQFGSIELEQHAQPTR
jgi:hypothetical protein